MTRTLDAIIVGGGSVGLYLGCALAAKGLSFVVLEGQPAPLPQSRAIGIHPPSLERFSELGMVADFLERGVRVGRGLAFDDQRPLGSLDFSLLESPYPFILTLPQRETERLLEQHLCTLAPGSLLRGASFTGFTEDAAGVTVRFTQYGQEQEARARYLIGCDGKNSRVRELARIPYRGGAYPDTYLMGDFRDNTSFGSDAALYLCREGIVESFPLPDGVRRWVLKTDGFLKDTSAEMLGGLLESRLGVRLELNSNTMLSAFGVQRYLAERFVQGRVILAGDAAHVVSPIGGQGMNLGWLDAHALAGALAGKETLENYARTRRRAARVAIWRAEFNTVAGRRTRFSTLRGRAIGWALESPLKATLARMFTMQGL